MQPLQLILAAYTIVLTFLGSGYQAVFKWLQDRDVRARQRRVASWVYNHGFEAISWAGYVAFFFFNIILIWIMSRGTGARIKIRYELLQFRHFRVVLLSLTRLQPQSTLILFRSVHNCHDDIKENNLGFHSSTPNLQANTVVSQRLDTRIGSTELSKCLLQ
jgi:hypothetical protein